MVTILVLLAGHARAQNAVRPFKDRRPTSLADARRAEPRIACDAVVSLTTYEFSILSAMTVTASGAVPTFCRILGQILQVRFELSLPAQWNGRLYMFGNGGSAPVLDMGGTLMSEIWNQKMLAAAPITAEHMKVVADAVYGKCDASDGLSDGEIADPRRCAFKPSDLPRCAEGQPRNACFTTEQVQTLNAIYGGVKSGDRSIGAGWPIGSEVAAPSAAGVRTGWVPWLLPPQPDARPLNLVFAEGTLRYMAFGKPDPTYDWKTFDFDKDPQRMQHYRSIADATNPDLTRFRGRGGKILMYFGWADPALNPLMGVQYYEQVTQRMAPSTPDFFKLYMVPGMFHCGGGIGTSVFDAVTPLVEWVEKSAAPTSIPAARELDGRIVRTRPLCPYPQVARYRGSGSIDDGANFVCATPAAVPVPTTSSTSN